MPRIEWTSDEIDILSSKLIAYHAGLQAADFAPTQRNNSVITKLKTKLVDQVMETPVFIASAEKEPASTKVIPQNLWRKTLRDVCPHLLRPWMILFFLVLICLIQRVSKYFDNHKNPSKKSAVVQPAIASSSSSTTSYPNSSAPPSSPLLPPTQSGIKAKLDQMLEFSSDACGRKLFLRENEAAIEELARKSKVQNRAGAYQNAKAELWKQADQEAWNERAAASMDIEQ